MAYTVTASGTFSESDGYFTINGTTYYAAGTWTFDSKPTITITTRSNGGSSVVGDCTITVNGTTVSTGDNTYTLETDDDTIDIVFTKKSLLKYYRYSAAVTTSHSDPMAPKDGHNANIGAVAFQIESGTVRYGGAAYEIESGMTRVNGVAWEIPFKPSVFTVTITGTGHQNICYVKIGTTKHYTAKTLEVEPGTAVTFHAQRKNSSSGAAYADIITLNGVKVSGGTGTSSDYEYTINGNISVQLNYSSNSNGGYDGNIAITEE